MDELLPLRQLGMKALAVVSLCCSLLVCAAAWLESSGPLPVVLAVLLPVLPGWMAWHGRADSAARVAMGITVIAYPMIYVAQFSGSALQIDLHMTFFVALAGLAALADWRPLLIAAVLAAVHHLTTNFLAPALVFPNGPDFLRVVVHAVVVVAETVWLLLTVHRIEQLVTHQARLREETAAIEAASLAERERTHAEQAGVIATLGARLRELAAGDLGTEIAAPFPDTYEDLRAACNSATASLAALVAEVSTTAAQIESGAGEIRAAGDDLARRTEQQASAVEHSTATTSRLAGAVGESARAAAEVSAAIHGAQADAEAGGSVVAEAIEAMRLIEGSTSEINQIITLIDGIAFQTNLLALNAGVEAARAGDAGKGFAVVANEVRALAQRSADAASTIRALISASTEQVTHGVELVGETGAMLGKIVAQVVAVSGAITAISEQALRQADDLSQVNSSFRQIDTMTQQNAAMVEESSAASHSLAQEAERLAALVARFRIGNAGAGLEPTRLAA